MGQGIEVVCSNCGYEDSFFLGVGRMYSYLRNVIDFVHHSRRKQILDILDNHKVKECEFSNELFTCEKCNKLAERLFIEIDYDENEKYVSEFKCHKCKKIMNKLEFEEIEEILNLPCPKCKNKSFDQFSDIMWD